MSELQLAVCPAAASNHYLLSISSNALMSLCFCFVSFSCNFSCFSSPLPPVDIVHHYRRWRVRLFVDVKQPVWSCYYFVFTNNLEWADVSQSERRWTSVLSYFCCLGLMSQHAQELWASNLLFLSEKHFSPSNRKKKWWKKRNDEQKLPAWSPLHVLQKIWFNNNERTQRGERMHNSIFLKTKSWIVSSLSNNRTWNKLKIDRLY